MPKDVNQAMLTDRDSADINDMDFKIANTFIFRQLKNMVSAPGAIVSRFRSRKVEVHADIPNKIPRQRRKLSRVLILYRKTVHQLSRVKPFLIRAVGLKGYQTHRLDRQFKAHIHNVLTASLEGKPETFLRSIHLARKVADDKAQLSRDRTSLEDLSKEIIKTASTIIEENKLRSALMSALEDHNSPINKLDGSLTECFETLFARTDINQNQMMVLTGARTTLG